MQPCLVVQLAVELVSADWPDGGGPLDGPESVGEGGEAVEVFAGLEVDDVGARSPWRVVSSAAVDVAVDFRDAVLLVLSAAPLLLGGVTLAMLVVDAKA